MALNPAAAARSRMLRSSARCWSAESADRDGQSMFATVATHRPRISRTMAGGVVPGSTVGGPVTSSGDEHALTSTSATHAPMQRARRVLAGERFDRQPRWDEPIMRAELKAERMRDGGNRDLKLQYDGACDHPFASQPCCC